MIGKTLLVLTLMAFWIPTAGASDRVSPVIVVSIEGGGRVVEGNSLPRIVVAAWPDGRIAWSEDHDRGGPPFREARIDPARIEVLLARFAKASVFKEDGVRRSWFGPDSAYHSIYLDFGEEPTRIESWHEWVERNPDLVVLNGSITALRGRDREEVIAADAAEFRAFRRFWVELRTSVARLIPPEGNRVEGPLEFTLPRRRD